MLLMLHHIIARSIGKMDYFRMILIKRLGFIKRAMNQKELDRKIII